MARLNLPIFVESLDSSIGSVDESKARVVAAKVMQSIGRAEKAIRQSQECVAQAMTAKNEINEHNEECDSPHFMPPANWRSIDMGRTAYRGYVGTDRSGHHV